MPSGLTQPTGPLRWAAGALFLGRLLLVLLVGAGAPLASGLVIHPRGGPLARVGFLYYLLIFYLAVLAVDM